MSDDSRPARDPGKISRRNFLTTAGATGGGGLLAFLGPEMARPQVMVGRHSHWEGLDLGNHKVHQYFSGMQRPVEAFVRDFAGEPDAALGCAARSASL